MCESEGVCTHTDVFGRDLQWHKIGAFTAYKIISELSVFVFLRWLLAVFHMMGSENEYCVFRTSHLPYIKVTKERGDRLLILVKKFLFFTNIAAIAII